MRHVISHQVVLSQAPEGPLATWLDRFADAASGQGYTRSSICRRILLAAGFSRWLGREGIDLGCINSDHPAQYLRYRTRRVRLAAYPAMDSAGRGDLRLFLFGFGLRPAGLTSLASEFLIQLAGVGRFLCPFPGPIRRFHLAPALARLPQLGPHFS